LDGVLAAFDRQAHAEALGIDQVRLRGKANQLHLMTAEQQLGGQQRPVGRAHDQDVVSRRHSEPPPRGGGRRRAFILLAPTMLFGPPSPRNPARHGLAASGPPRCCPRRDRRERCQRRTRSAPSPVGRRSRPVPSSGRFCVAGCYEVAPHEPPLPPPDVPPIGGQDGGGVYDGAGLGAGAGVGAGFAAALAFGVAFFAALFFATARCFLRAGAAFSPVFRFVVVDFAFLALFS